MEPVFSTRRSKGTPDEPAVLHPVPDWTPPTWLSAIVRWAPVVLALVVSTCWFVSFSSPGGPHLLVLVPMALVLAALAVFAVVRTGGWLTRRAQSPPTRLPLPALLVGGVVVATWVSTSLGLPVELRFERNRAELDRIVEELRLDPPEPDPRPGRSLQVESGGYGTLTVTEVPGGWHLATPSPGGRDGVPGFVHLHDLAAATAWPEGRALRPLGDGWYVADLPA